MVGEEYNLVLDYSEVQARVFKILRHFIDSFKGDEMSMRFESYLSDEFERINLLTSLEAEFNIILPENVFENLENLD